MNKSDFESNINLVAESDKMREIPEVESRQIVKSNS
jgi:hypothetical protein